MQVVLSERDRRYDKHAARDHRCAHKLRGSHGCFFSAAAHLDAAAGFTTSEKEG
jgi:hypothetical protein